MNPESQSSTVNLFDQLASIEDKVHHCQDTEARIYQIMNQGFNNEGLFALAHLGLVRLREKILESKAQKLQTKINYFSETLNQI